MQNSRLVIGYQSFAVRKQQVTPTLLLGTFKISNLVCSSQTSLFPSHLFEAWSWISPALPYCWQLVVCVLCKQICSVQMGYSVIMISTVRVKLCHILITAYKCVPRNIMCVTCLRRPTHSSIIDRQTGNQPDKWWIRDPWVSACICRRHKNCNLKSRYTLSSMGSSPSILSMVSMHRRPVPSSSSSVNSKLSTPWKQLLPGV